MRYQQVFEQYVFAGTIQVRPVDSYELNDIEQQIGVTLERSGWKPMAPGKYAVTQGQRVIAAGEVNYVRKANPELEIKVSNHTGDSLSDLVFSARAMITPVVNLFEFQDITPPEMQFFYLRS